ncbi:hypothetical protein RO3G_02654 [Rhizopus delemar RA 99-880]|uniref:Coth-domain-containing protein n=1 Tax=Rhizopus delemar (strain RA 99-880 / ATCC MYA-4621 / FGSC 9543 / NRRL 43880) TaxID=246409 RepID=I1BP20_RHIO9|nr:hypothetical protein RO3G_02654 [Rhizopus delemar RA 99-880]|eukprot:EIE77950.1 hypothetical protein RO3G_02654 [Rhizopus delemar RA 99-880]
MVSIIHTLLALLLSVFSIEAQDNSTAIEYNVIALLNQTVFKSMAVVVDNVSYPLESNTTFPIIYSAKAPAAQTGYQYAKVYSSNDSMLIESFTRQPVTENTPHEFFNRSWNTHDNVQLPQIYSMLSSVNRISSDLHKDNQIPTIHIIGNQTELDEMNTNSTADITVQTNLSYVSLFDAIRFEDVEISLSGRSSRWMPKLSYKLELKKGDSLYGYRYLRLRALATDPSYVREQVAFNMVRSVGLVSSEFSYVRVFMNNQELGLFGILDTFKNPWLANVFDQGNTTYENGYLYQAVYLTPNSVAQNVMSDLSYMSNHSLYGLGQYNIEEEATHGDKVNWTALIGFTRFIANAPTVDSSETIHAWNQQLDVESFLRSAAIEVLAGFSDGYIALADNYYLYQNPQRMNQFIYIPSDLDLTFGNTLFKLSEMWSGNYSTYPGLYDRPLMNQILKVGKFKARYEHLLQDINIQLMRPDVIVARIDSIASMIKQDVVWDQSLARVAVTEPGSLISVQDRDVGTNRPIELDNATFNDLINRTTQVIPFEIALNGPTGHISLSGVKEWIEAIRRNTTEFFKVHNMNFSLKSIK